MSNNTNEPKALVIPDAAQIQHDAELFGVTKQYIEYAGSVATGQQEGTQEDVVNALAVVHENIAALQQSHLLSSAAVAGLQEAVDKLTEQRDQVITEKEEIESVMQGAMEESWQEGYDQGAADAEEMGFEYSDYDAVGAWDTLQDNQGYLVGELVKKLTMLGEIDGAKGLQDQWDLAFKHYEEAARLIEQYDRFTYEKRNELTELRLAERAANLAANAAHPGNLDDEASDDEDEE